MLSEFEKREGELVKRIQKKHGKGAAIGDKLPTAESLRSDRPIEYLLLSGWIRCGCLGDPGFMFYSDNALGDLFSLLDWDGFEVDPEGVNSEQIEQLRGRLALRKASNKTPYITGVRMSPDSGIIQLNSIDAKLAASEWPKRPSKLRSPILLNGRQLYGGVPG